MDSWESLTIRDNFIFSKVMETNPDLCRRIIEIILDIKIDHIEYLEREQTLQTRLDSKGIRLDVYVEDGSRSFNLEMQLTDSKSLGQRMRYYQGLIDMDKIGKGQFYDQLGESYVIFICTFDHFKRGLHKYTFRESCLEDNNLQLGDGTTKVILNATAIGNDVNVALKSFLDYVADGRVEHPLAEELDNNVERVKLAKEWRLEYMTFEMLLKERERQGKEEGKEEGKVEGKAEGIVLATLENLKSLMKSLNFTLEQAMDALKIPVEERRQYVDKLSR